MPDFKKHRKAQLIYNCKTQNYLTGRNSELMNPSMSSLAGMFQELTDEQQIYMQKFQQFKQKYTKVREIYKNGQKEVQLLRESVLALENKISLADTNLSFAEAVKLQKMIVEHLQQKDDYLAMQNACDTLQNKVCELEKKLQTERKFYEGEINRIIEEKTRKEATTESDRENYKNGVKKIHLLEFSNQELIRANEVLKALMDEFTVEAEKDRAYFTTQHLKYEREIEELKESNSILESKNSLLYEQLVEQEKWFQNQNAEPLRKPPSDQFSHQLSSKKKQTVDEAFCITEDMVKESEEHSPLVPFTTGDCPDLFDVDCKEPFTTESSSDISKKLSGEVNGIPTLPFPVS